MVRPGLVAAGAAVLAAVSLTVVTSCASGEPAPAPGASSVVTSTTRLAGAGVLGNDRRPDESCPAQPVAPDAAPRLVRHASGETEVPADPQRIVVLAGDELDALCALGLQGRIVAAALPDDSSTQPWYLGTTVHNLKAAGTRTTPNIDEIRAAKPDLILGSKALTPQLYPALSTIAPTVFSGPAGAAWQDNVRLVGAATGRGEAAGRLVDDFNAYAARAGAEQDAAHFQASIVQLTENSLRIYGADNFAASVMIDFGVDRPQAQRFTDKPYVEVGTSDLDTADFRAADGDIVYLSFTSAKAKERAPEILYSDAWRQLSATRDNRVFAVNNEIWHLGQGIVAARAVVTDLRWVNAAIN